MEHIVIVIIIQERHWGLMILFLTENKLSGISTEMVFDHRLFLLREIGCCVGIVFGLAFGEVVRNEGRPTLSDILPTAENRWAIYYLTNSQPRIDYGEGHPIGS